MGQNATIRNRYDLRLSFEESVFGVKREIEVSYLETCDGCGGTGAKSSDAVKQCSSCGGKGRVMESQRRPFGIMSQVSTCSKCGDDGKIITDKCRNCIGNGRLRLQSRKKLHVVVPPGATMRIQGEGTGESAVFDLFPDMYYYSGTCFLNKVSNFCSGRAGDLFIVLQVDEKRGIKREGLNLYSKVSIDFTDAILGDVTKVETVEGTMDLRIPPGTQPGDTVKLRRKGVFQTRIDHQSEETIAL
ncbi:unnamed protein product [Arabis nemorensis]|uniref:CR-type domain-containing protein n=1 Tax=Arabis nemorensis TaxID=586526 RepID=A0A565B935_9BRAS|nr:unnamed protein product [Arabis nemorensis]